MADELTNFELITANNAVTPSKPEPIPVDEQAILALQRVTTGAYIHDSNELISWYKNACRMGRYQSSERYKVMMYERAIAIAQGTIQY